MPSSTVSVIVPAYRAAATLPRAVASILAQSRPVQEILVVDDGSPEDPAPALAPFSERVRLLRKPNGGAASARNFGIDHATGELVAFLDADDYWEPDKIAQQVAILERLPDVGLTAGQFYAEVPGSPRELHAGDRNPTYDQPLHPTGNDILYLAVCVWTSMVLVRRAVLADLRFDTTLRTAEDVDLWIRLLLKGGVYLTATPLATSVLTPGSLSRSNPSRDFPNMLTVVRRYREHLTPGELRAWEAHIYRDWAASALTTGHPGQALHPAWQRLVREPWKLQCWWILLKASCWSISPFPLRRGRQR
jgi:glycosyltransferase involved in cell wall biosynthesis